MSTEYRASKFKTAEGHYDFSQACPYDEQIVVCNIKKSKSKEVFVLKQQDTAACTLTHDFETENKTVKRVSRINSVCELRMRSNRRSKSVQKEEQPKLHPYYELVQKFC